MNISDTLNDIVYKQTNNRLAWRQKDKVSEYLMSVSFLTLSLKMTVNTAFITVHTGDGVFCLGNAYYK